MTAVEKLEVGLFASILIVILPALFATAYWLVG
jgi:hypothetical protein